MWKYINIQKINQMLLSLNLVDNSLSDKDKIRLLYTISNNTSLNYNIIKIKKSNGAYRTIYAPHPNLKYIQRQILKNILNNKAISKYATAYHKGSSLKTNGAVHVNRYVLLKLDIKDFFDNISLNDIYHNAFPLEYFPQQLGMLLANICAYGDKLPQGAPTSAFISNLVMKDFDEEVGHWCTERNIGYTRYSDDMTFSGDFNPSEIIIKVRKLLYTYGMDLNLRKTHIVKHSQRQSVTGLVVNEKLQTPAGYRKDIRQKIYFIKKYGIKEHLDHIGSNDTPRKYLASLYGRITYVLQINKDDKEFQEYKEWIVNQ